MTGPQIIVAMPQFAYFGEDQDEDGLEIVADDLEEQAAQQLERDAVDEFRQAFNALWPSPRS